MRVLQVNKLYPPPRAGIEVVVEDIARELAAAGDASAVLASGPRAAASLRDGVAVRLARSLGTVLRMPVAPSVVPLLWRLARDTDVVLLHHPYPLGFLAYLLAGRGKPLVVWYHADIVRQRVTGFLLRPLIAACLRRAAVILVASEALAGSRALAPYRDAVRVVPFGIDPAWAVRDAPTLKRAAAIRAAHPGTLALAFGRLVGYKGLPVLLRALADAPGVRLLVVGDGPDRDALVALAGALGLGDRVAFEPGPEDARPYFLACDFLALPSVTPAEAFAVTQLEAMAYGKPVINTALPTGVPEVSRDGETGITVPPGDAAALAAALRTLAGDATLRARYGTAARTRIERRFSRARFAAAVRGALDAARRRPAR